MWIFLSDSFLSIVHMGGDPDRLLVRGRIKGDIEAVFPAAHVTQTNYRDYRYRATVSREDVAHALTTRVMELRYPNFKNTVTEEDRHDAYLDVWSAMARFQEERT